uniref:PID domain-containing protein n=1 Tax=Caenorhabditis japonica TaxID=281687 RepID=A0A8R1DJM6_CAEJA
MAQKSEISIETTNAATNGTTTNTTKANPSSPKSRLAVLKRTKKASNAASDPFRFQNNGISYKGKLIGEQDVDTARGDAMCAEAMRNAKGIIKAAGAHKTRITLQINIDGIKVLDEKSGAVLHNFPVSRISFIARDSSDARAFGLVYGEPGGKYKFYGIKTAQSADQAVLAIRDMFQVVFEMKKKHIEQVKLQQKTGGADVSKTKEEGVAVADLLDLESELQQIEQGVQQLSTLPTNFDAFGASPFGDPFADSFNTTANSTANSTATMNMSANSQQRSFPAAFGIQQPPVPTTMPACQDWPTNTAATTAAVAPSPFGAWAPMDHVPMHHAQSTPAFGSNSFAETNPFASAFGAPVPVPTAPVPTVTAPPPPPQQQLRDPFLVSSSNALQGTIDWNGTHGTTKENMAPIVSQPLHHANTFANFGDNNFRTTSWEEKKVTSLEEAFTKLVDMDALIGGGSAVQETKKNPFEHILNPPKASLNSLSTTCSSQMVASQHAQQHTAADPFGDDFFR